MAPGKNAMQGAAITLLVIISLLWLFFAIRFYVETKDPWLFVFFVLMYLVVLLFGYLARWLFKKLNAIHSLFLLAILIGFPLLLFMTGDPVTILLSIIILSLLGGGYFVFRKTGFRSLSKTKKVITLLGSALGIGGIIFAGIAYNKKGFEMDKMVNAAATSDSNISKIMASSPSEAGPYKVKSITYGSGKDLRRAEFGSNANITTKTVNGLPFIDGWDGISGWWREKYWGFKSDSLPINARVWYPEGDGPFPLALVVHGNHLMQDFSDPGYDYLGELLASRGVILASVDENFINSSWSDVFGGLDTENDARGWLLLEHLKVWHEWNDTPGNQFHQKIDINNLALIGHSRGGEAVAHAAMFNTLSHYPDDATIPFDYNYNIKSVIAIAPVDGQYEPGNTRTKLEDVNYFVIHGAQDADVSSFMGSQQYERVKFSDSTYHFKAGLYVYGANHGQFNTSWGNNDTAFFTGMLNLEQLLSAEDQERIAEVFISSFLDITLKGQHEYLPLFLDARTGKDWLPETVYLHQFEDSEFQAIANFDEDFDVATLTEEKGNAAAENLTVWREAEIELKWGKKGSRALFLGWDYELETPKDSIAMIPDSTLASYSVHIPSMAIDSTAALVFTMAESKESSNPKTEGKWVIDKEKENEEEEEEESDEVEEEEEEDEIEKPIDFTLEITDSSGQKVSFPLSAFSGLQREIDIMIMKIGFLTDDSQSEKIFQTFYFPMEEMRNLNPNFDPTSINSIQWIFNKSDKGVIVIDNLGFMKRFEALLPQENTGI